MLLPFIEFSDSIKIKIYMMLNCPYQIDPEIIGKNASLGIKYKYCICKKKKMSIVAIIDTMTFIMIFQKANYLLMFFIIQYVKE